MGKLSLFVWIVAAPVLMGAFVLAVLLVPSLAQDEMKYMLPAAILGAVVAAPISIIIGKKIESLTSQA